MVIFTSKFSQIKTHSDVESLKAMVSVQMKLVLLTIPFGGAALLLYLNYGFTDLLDIYDTYIFFSLIAVNIFFTEKARKIEQKIKSIPVSNNELKEQYEHIIYVWQKKLLPNFE